MHPQKKWRGATGVTQAQLSKASELLDYPAVDQGLISKVEKGDHLPGIETVFRLCIATANLSSIVEPLRVIHYAPSELATTYNQTMEDWYGLAKGETAGTAAETGRGGAKAKEAAPKAVSAAHQRTRTRRKSRGKRKAAKAAKAKKTSYR